MSLEVRVERLGTGGDGIAHHESDGRVIFVRGGLPGDLWRGSLHPLGGNALRLEPLERLADGAARIEQRCPVRPACGGCNWHELRADAAVQAKREILIDCLRRIAGFEGALECRLEEPHGAAVGGRHRVGLKVGPEGLAYSERGSHNLVSLRSCAALAPPLEAAMLSLARALPQLPPGLLGIQASLSADGKVVAARLAVSDELTDSAARRLCQAVVRHSDIDGAWLPSDSGAVEAGQVRIKGLIGTGFSSRYRLRGGGFHQASPAVNEALIRAVVDEAAVQRRQRVVDMHGGAGNFGLVLGAKGADVSIAEVDRWASEDLALNAAAFEGRGQVHVATMTGDQALLRTARRGDVHRVIFDAPRNGDRTGAERVAEVRPHRVIALGCDPATFARDLKTMGLGAGYRLTRLSLWDAFPGTHHSEALAVLERQD